ncbi:hypothetical protein O9929_21560 [Vibrio lentus]|nr:hypothetical protein [Vibrio lentus]
MNVLNGQTGIDTINTHFALSLTSPKCIATSLRPRTKVIQCCRYAKALSSSIMLNEPTCTNHKNQVRMQRRSPNRINDVVVAPGRQP